MKIGTGLTGIATAKYQSRCMKIVFDLVSTHATTAGALAQLLASTVEITSSHPSYATKTRVYKNSLQDLLEIASCNEGAIRVAGATTAWTIKGTLELSNDGAIVPLENEQFTVNLVLDAGLTGDLYTLDSHEDAVTEIEYKPLPCFANTPTPVNVLNARWLAIHKANFTKVELEMPNGQRIEFAPAELDQMVSEGNEQSLIVAGLVTAGSNNMFIIPVAPFRTAHVTCTVQQNVYVVNETLIRN